MTTTAQPMEIDTMEKQTGKRKRSSSNSAYQSKVERFNKVRRDQEQSIKQCERPSASEDAGGACERLDPAALTRNRYLVMEKSSLRDDQASVMRHIEYLVGDATEKRATTATPQDTGKTVLETNLMSIDELRDDLQRAQRIQELSGPSVSMKNIVEQTGNYEDADTLVRQNWLSESGGVRGNKDFIMRAKREIAECSTAIQSSSSFMSYNCALWPEHVAMFLHEASANGERQCVNAASHNCKAALYLPHPESRIHGGPGDETHVFGAVLREFLTPIEYDRFRSGKGLPHDQRPCYICLLYAHQINVFSMPLADKPVPSPGFHHVTGVSGGYTLASTIQSVKNQVDGRLLPVRHFVVSEYLPCKEPHPDTGQLRLGYMEVTRVFYLRGLPTATLQTASRGLAPFTESVAHTERIRFSDLLLRRLDTVYTDEARMAYNRLMMGSFKQLCHCVSTLVNTDNARTIATIVAEVPGISTIDTEPADAARKFLGRVQTEPLLWTRVVQPALSTHIVAYVCVMRDNLARTMRDELEQRRKQIGFGRSQVAKLEVRNTMEAIGKLAEFIRGHRELMDLIVERIECQQPFDDTTLLGENNVFAYHELGSYDPDEFDYSLTNADMANSLETASFYSFPTPQQQLAARYTNRILLTVGSEGSVSARDVFTDFCDTVEFVRRRGHKWSTALRKMCGGFESIIDEFDVKKQWEVLVQQDCSIITALILRVHCAQILRAERGCDNTTAYTLTLFANTHLELAMALDWTDPEQLVDSHIQGRAGILAMNYPWPTAMLHEGSMDAHDAALNYVGFFDTGTQQKEHKSWLHMILKAVPRCCEVRASEGINKSTCVVDPPCGDWLLRCIEASLCGVMQHCATRLSFPATIAARRLVAHLRIDDNLTKFICEHQVLCKHVMREHLLLLLKYNPVMRDIIKMHCPWFEEFTHHVYAFMDRIRDDFAVSHALILPEAEAEYEADLARSSGWNNRVYRWFKRSFPGAVVRFTEEIDKGLAEQRRTVPVHLQPDENKCEFMRIMLEAECESGPATTAQLGSSRSMHDSVIERDCRMLERFGLRNRAIQTVRTLYGMYLRFVKRWRFMDQMLRLAPDEYALVRAYYTILADVQCVQQHNINSSAWNYAVLDALCAKFDLDTRSDVPAELTTLVTTPCCKSIGTQIAMPDEEKPAKLVSCATITYDISHQRYACLGSKDAKRRKPPAKKPAVATTDPARRTRRKAPAPRIKTAHKHCMCMIQPVKQHRAFGKTCSFMTKYREKREQSSQTKYPIILSPCCGTWMRYRNSLWRNGFRCLSCAIATGNDPAERICVVCARTGGGRVATNKKTSRSSSNANARTFRNVMVVDDLLVGRARPVSVCSECMARLPREIGERLPFLSELPELYRAGSERRHQRAAPRTSAQKR